MSNCDEDITMHNNLGSLQGGTMNERYHLTKDQWHRVVTGTTDRTISNKTYLTDIAEDKSFYLNGVSAVAYFSTGTPANNSRILLGSNSGRGIQWQGNTTGSWTTTGSFVGNPTFTVTDTVNSTTIANQKTLQISGFNWISYTGISISDTGRVLGSGWAIEPSLAPVVSGSGDTSGSLLAVNSRNVITRAADGTIQYAYQSFTYPAAGGSYTANYSNTQSQKAFTSSSGLYLTGPWKIGSAGYFSATPDLRSSFYMSKGQNRPTIDPSLKGDVLVRYFNTTGTSIDDGLIVTKSIDTDTSSLMTVGFGDSRYAATFGNGVTNSTGVVSLGGTISSQVNIVINDELNFGGLSGGPALSLKSTGAYLQHQTTDFKSFLYCNNNSVTLSSNNILGNKALSIILDSDLAGLGLLVGDTVFNRGLVNNGDYEAQFVNRSLVTKQYVDSKTFDMAAYIQLRPVYADDATAAAAGLADFEMYRTATGELRYKVQSSPGFPYTMPLPLI